MNSNPNIDVDSVSVDSISPTSKIEHSAGAVKNTKDELLAEVANLASLARIQMNEPVDKFDFLIKQEDILGNNSTNSTSVDLSNPISAYDSSANASPPTRYIEEFTNPTPTYDSSVHASPPTSYIEEFTGNAEGYAGAVKNTKDELLAEVANLASFARIQMNEPVDKFDFLIKQEDILGNNSTNSTSVDLSNPISAYDSSANVSSPRYCADGSTGYTRDDLELLSDEKKLVSPSGDDLRRIAYNEWCKLNNPVCPTSSSDCKSPPKVPLNEVIRYFQCFNTKLLISGLSNSYIPRSCRSKMIV